MYVSIFQSGRTFIVDAERIINLKHSYIEYKCVA